MAKSLVELYAPHEDPSVMQDVSALEAPVHSDQFVPGMQAEFSQSWESTLTYKGGRHLYDYEAQKDLTNNRMLTPDEAKESIFYRPGMDVSNGISEYMLRASAVDYDRKQNQDFWISQMPNNAWGWVARKTMDIIGQATDLPTDAMLLLAPETVGIRSAAFVAKAGSTVPKLITNAGIGAAEGAVIGAPQFAANLMNANPYLPDEDKVANAFYNLGGMMLFGSVIRGFTGYKEPISQKASQYANQVSIDQTANGYFPNVDSVLQQGYYDARSQAENPAAMKNSQDANLFTVNDLSGSQKQSFIQPAIDTLSEGGQIEQINKIKKGAIGGRLSTLIDNAKQAIVSKLPEDVTERLIDNRPDLRSKFSIHEEGILTDELNKSRVNGNMLNGMLPEELTSDKNAKSTSDMVHDIINDIDNNPEEISQTTQNYMQNKLPGYIRTAVEILRKTPENRSRTEANQLAQILFGDESNRVKADSRNIAKQMKGDMSDAEILLLKNEKKALSTRKKQLEKLKEKYGDYWQAKQVADASKIKQADIIRALKRNQVYKEMAHNTGVPVNQADLKLNIAQLMDVSNELAFDANQKSIADMQAEALEGKTPEDFMEEATQAMSVLDDEEQSTLKEQLSSIQKSTTQFNKAIQNMAQCLLGGANG